MPTQSLPRCRLWSWRWRPSSRRGAPQRPAF